MTAPHIELELCATDGGDVLVRNLSTVELEIVESDGASVGLPPSARGIATPRARVRTPPGRDYAKPAPVDEHELRHAKRIGMNAYRSQDVDFLWITRLPDGRALFLEPWNGGGVQLSLGHIGGAVWLDVWNFHAEQRDAGWRAVLSWDGHGEPEGWTRHPHTGRVREDGTATSERRER